MKRPKPIQGEIIYFANHSPNIFDRAVAATQRNDGIAAAILSVASIEALLPDLATCLDFLREHSETCLNKPGPGAFARVYNRPAGRCVFPWGHELSERESMLLDDLDRYEKDRTSISDKVKGVLNFLNDAPVNSEDDVIRNFELLIDVRNELVHPKSERISRRTKNGLGSGNIYGQRAVVARLEGRKLIRRPEEGESWLNLLDQLFAKWCLTSAAATIEIVLAALPDSPLIAHFRSAADLRWNPDSFCIEQ